MVRASCTVIIVIKFFCDFGSSRTPFRAGYKNSNFRDLTKQMDSREQFGKNHYLRMFDNRTSFRISSNDGHPRKSHILQGNNRVPEESLSGTPEGTCGTDHLIRGACTTHWLPMSAGCRSGIEEEPIRPRCPLPQGHTLRWKDWRIFRKD